MKKILIIVFSIISFYGFSQNEACAFSDSYYHYSAYIVISDLTSDFDKADFIEHLETNSNISNSEVSFLENNLVEIFKLFPNSNSEPFNKFIRIIASDDSLYSFLTPFSESLNQVGLLCNCAYSDGFFYNYVRLVTDVIPDDDFDKVDFMNHLENNSSPTNLELDFLNNVISEVYKASPASQVDETQKVMIVVSDYDLMFPYLFNFPLSFDRVELICGEDELSINDYPDFGYLISIIPNPVVETSIIKIDKQLLLKELQIIDLSGKILFEKIINGFETINMSDFKLNSGLYFFKFSDGNNSTVKKVIIK